MAKTPMRVAVTGAAGQIGYALLFRIANGDMLGKDQPVILQLLEIPDEKAQKALKGVMMEIDDCAFPLLTEMTAHSDPLTAFKDADVAVLVGARPRGPGMERKDLLEANAQIFTVQGKALDAVASRNVKVLVVGNPANTNAYIAMKSAPSLPAKNFTAMLRLDHNRALSQVAAKTGTAVKDIEKLTVWGNHSPNRTHSHTTGNSNGFSSSPISASGLSRLIFPSAINRSFSARIFCSSTLAGSSAGSCGTSLPCTARVRMSSRSLATPPGAVASRFKFDSSMRLFLKR